MTEQDITANLNYVSQRIVERYGHPARTAYLYLFRVKPSRDLESLIPTAEEALTAWVDEGSGLLPSAIEVAIERCQSARNAKPDLDQPHQRSPHQRRQMMARIVTFSVSQVDMQEIDVTLASRSLTFTPKGDRIVHEQWRPIEGGGWYSARTPEDF